MKKFSCFLLLLAFITSGCAHAPISKSARQRPAKILTSMRDVQEEYSERLSAISSLCANAKIKVHAGLRNLVFSQEFRISKPHYLRIETLSPLGQTLSVLTANAQTLAFYEADRGTIDQFTPSSEGIRELFPVDLSPEEFVRIALTAPFCPLKQLDKVDYETSTNSYRIVYAAGTEKECSLWLDPNQFYPLKFVLRRSHLTVLYRHFVSFPSNGGPSEGEHIVWFPQEIELLWEGGEKMRIAWEEPMLNCKIPPEAFSLPPQPVLQE